MDPLPLLRELIAIPSLNPMGRDVAGPEYFESRVSDWLMQFFARLDVPCERVEVLPGRANVFARLDHPGATTTILLDAHQDTVPADGMTIAPFDPVVKDGRIYGRGACDVKGGLAAMLAAFARLARERPANAANVIMACTCDEEFRALGSRTLAQSWKDAAQIRNSKSAIENPTCIAPPSPTLSPQGGKGEGNPVVSCQSTLAVSPPTVCVVAEPTDLNVVVAHRGAMRWKLRTTGRACHSSRPHEGSNAIYKMAQVLSCLERYADELPHMVPVHPLCGPATLSVGLIAGGISVNTVPGECVIDIDRRVVPGEDPQAVVPHISTYLRERLDVDFEMLPAWTDGATLSDRDNGPWADRLLTCVEATAGKREKQGAFYGTNASRYAGAGVPAIVCGPGSIAQAHTVDEWIDIEQLRQAAEIYYRFCANSSE